jgi:hypothetical protein
MPRCALNRANAGAELCPGMMPDPLRMAFYVRRLASCAKEWWSDLVDAKTVMEEFAEGGQVPRESLFNTCQAMSLLGNRLRVDDSKFDPVRLDRSVRYEHGNVSCRPGNFRAWRRPSPHSTGFEQIKNNPMAPSIPSL